MLSACLKQSNKKATTKGRPRDPGGIRTHDPQLRRLLLYPTELLDRFFISGGKITKNNLTRRSNALYLFVADDTENTIVVVCDRKNR